MLNQEEVYRLLAQGNASAIVKLLYKHQKEIVSDDLLKFAASVFETEFFKTVTTSPIENVEIRDNLETLYLLNHSSAYLLKSENFKILILELVRRVPVEQAGQYAKYFPDEAACKEAIEKADKFRRQRDGVTLNQPKPNMEWIKIYNRLFELMNSTGNAATYFSGSRFIDVIKEFDPYFPNYRQFIDLRNNEGKSTSRKIYYYDILFGLEDSVRNKVIDRFLDLLRPHEQAGVAAIEVMLGKRKPDDVISPVEIKAVPEGVPTTLISYSWDDEPHKDWVLNLAEKLIANGVNVLLDRYELRAGRSIPHFVENAIAKADKIVIVFTPNYKLKADNRAGGVGYEYSIINNQLYKDQLSNEKVIPILRKGSISEAIPEFMQQYIHIDISKDENFEASLNDLLREIFDEPRIKKPELGAKPTF